MWRKSLAQAPVPDRFFHLVCLRYLFASIARSLQIISAVAMLSREHSRFLAVFLPSQAEISSRMGQLCSINSIG